MSHSLLTPGMFQNLLKRESFPHSPSHKTVLAQHLLKPEADRSMSAGVTTGSPNFSPAWSPRDNPALPPNSLSQILARVSSPLPKDACGPWILQLLSPPPSCPSFQELPSNRRGSEGKALPREAHTEARETKTKVGEDICPKKNKAGR